MSCSAKLPIYAFFTAAFFPGHGALVMVGLYFLRIVMGILMALILRGTKFKGEPVPFVMELPNYRMPGAKNVCQLLWEKAKDFLQRAFTVIFVATIVIWFLQTFDGHLNVVTDSKDSLLAAISPLAAVSLLVFSLLYTLCVAAVSSIKRELGGKWALYVVIGQCVIAWIAALVVRLLGMAIGIF